MIHKASTRSEKYLEKYLRDMSVRQHNKRVGEPYQIADGAELLQPSVLQTPDDIDQCKTGITVDGPSACYSSL